MATIGDTCIDDAQLNTLATQLKCKKDSYNSATDRLTDLNGQITLLQSNSDNLIAANTATRALLSARITALAGEGKTSDEIVTDPQCVDYGASVRSNEAIIAGNTAKIAKINAQITAITAKQTSLGVDFMAIRAQMATRMDTLRE